MLYEVITVARHGLARGAVAQVAWAVGQEDVQHLRRADAVQDIDAGLFLEALRDLRRQRLARRDAGAKRA